MYLIIKNNTKTYATEVKVPKAIAKEIFAATQRNKRPLAETALTMIVKHLEATSLYAQGR